VPPIVRLESKVALRSPDPNDAIPLFFKHGLDLVKRPNIRSLALGSSSLGCEEYERMF
jgi:hypothetical protein